MVTTTSRAASSARGQDQRSLVELAALVVGAMFLLVGILGFVPGITQNFDALEFAGRESQAELLGVFQMSILHNIVHLLFGIAGIAAARTMAAARGFLIGFGAVYVVLFAYGMVIDRASAANFVPLNTADDWLHLGLGAGMILLGATLSRSEGDAGVRSGPR